MRRRLLIMTTVALLVLAPAATGWAAGSGEAGGSTGGGGGQVVVVIPGSDAGTFRPTAIQGGTGPADVECKFFLAPVNVGAVTPSQGDHVTDTSTLTDEDYVWLICRDRTSSEITFQNLFRWDPADPPVLAPTAAVLAQRAANGMTLPTPAVRTWPPAGTRGVVHLPVWLHVENWTPVSATASAGGLSATVEATPVRSEWDMDDGTITCVDGGTAYDPAARPDPDSSSCSFTYRRSSGVRPDGTFHSSVVVVWRLRWFATNGQGGDLGELSSPPAAFDVQIEESQALVAAGT